MATMWYKNVNCAVVYVDPAATGTNTGATPSDALTALPTPSAMTGGTVYLLRRGLAAAATYTLGLTTCSQNVVAIWGMPLATDEQYVMVPAEAKAAWDADVADRPVVQTVAQGTTPPTFSGFGFSVHRINFHFGFAAAMTNAYSINVTGTAFSATQIKSQLAGYDLGVVTSLSAPVNTKSIGAWNVTSFSARIADSEFQAPGWRDADGSLSPTEYTNDSALNYRNRDGTVVIENVVFRGAYGCYGYRGNGGMQCVRIAARCAYVKHLTFDLIDYHSAFTTQQYRSAWKLSARVLRANNIVVTFRQLGGQVGVTPSTSYLNDPDCSVATVGAPIYPTLVFVSADAASNASDASGYCDYIIDGVNIDGSGARSAVSGLVCSNTTWFSSAGTLYNGAFRFSIRNYVFSSPQSNRLNDTVTGLAVPTGSQVTLENCTVTYANTMAFAYVVGGTQGTAVVYQNGKATLRNCTGSGRLRLDSVAYADIPTFSVPAADIVNPIECYGGVVYIGTLTMPAGWASDSMLSAGHNAQLFVDTINLPGIITLSAGTTAEQQTINISNNGSPGAYKSWHRWMNVAAASVFRTGGALAALHVKSNTLSSTPRGPALSPRPFAAKAVAPGGTGLRRIVAYVAAKSMTATDIANTVSLEVTAPSGAADKAIFNSSGDGRLEVDASTWNNDTGLSIYRIVMVVPVDRNENLGVRVLFFPFASTTAYLYVDPKIDVTA